MALSVLTITFNENYKSESTVGFSIKRDNGSYLGPFNERFQITERTRVGEMQLGGPLLFFSDRNSGDIMTSGIFAAEIYYHALLSDYGASQLFTATFVDNVVTIRSKVAGNTFVNFSANSINTYDTVNETTVEIEKYQLNITASTFSEVVADACGKFNIVLTTDLDYDQATINNVAQVVAAPTTSFTKELLRDIDYVILLKKAVVSDLPAVVRYPLIGTLRIPTLVSTNFTLTGTLTLGTGTIRVQPNVITLLSYEYSIDDGATWQTSNIFSGLAAGPYTIKIKDKLNGVELGCEISIAFTVEQVVTKSPFIYISQANDFAFAAQEDIDDISVFRNQINSFSNTDKSGINYCSEALVQVADENRIQFKSSYDDITVTLRDELGNEFDIPVNKRTDNIGRFKSMDCIMNYYSEGKSIIYFTSGSLYDEAGDNIGSYSLNGNLPDFAIVGQFIEITAYGIMEIDDIIYLDSIGRKAIVVKTGFLETVPTVYIVKSEYNILNYNIFDFDVLWSVYGEDIYDILITFEDAEFTTAYYLSENINVKTVHENTVAIRSYNTNNRDIFYKYDITHFLRMPILSINTLIKDDIENNITDKSVDLVRSTVNEGNIFIFDDMVREHLVKLTIMLSMEYVFIDGEGYTKSDSFSYELIENTNLQKMSAQMLKNGLNYNNLTNYETGVELGYEDIELPNLLLNTTNFIKL